MFRVIIQARCLAYEDGDLWQHTQSLHQFGLAKFAAKNCHEPITLDIASDEDEKGKTFTLTLAEAMAVHHLMALSKKVSVFKKDLRTASAQLVVASGSRFLQLKATMYHATNCKSLKYEAVSFLKSLEFATTQELDLFDDRLR